MNHGSMQRVNCCVKQMLCFCSFCQVYFLCLLPDRHSVLAGNLAFPKGLSSGPGRPRVPPKSPVVFDVELVYVPGQLIIALAYKMCYKSILQDKVIFCMLQFCNSFCNVALTALYFLLQQAASQLLSHC